MLLPAGSIVYLRTANQGSNIAPGLFSIGPYGGLVAGPALFQCAPRPTATPATFVCNQPTVLQIETEYWIEIEDQARPTTFPGCATAAVAVGDAFTILGQSVTRLAMLEIEIEGGVCYQRWSVE